MPIKILIGDDDSLIREALEIIFGKDKISPLSDASETGKRRSQPAVPETSTSHSWTSGCLLSAASKPRL
jgi:hypothetical protein